MSSAVTRAGAAELATLPVGLIRFHRRSFINYQLNRAYALGHAREEDLRRGAASVRSADDCVVAFERESAEAAASGRLRHAASYQRLAEFFTPPRSAEKLTRYRTYRDLFDAAFGSTGVRRHMVSYADSTIPAYWCHSSRQPHRGTVLLHGGFDSLIEEFFSIWERIATAGFDVIAFEGRALSGLTFDHDWEKPVAAVLDHFGITSSALVGLSMGGYWALRAAGCESRIDRLVSWPPVYDWLHRIPTTARPLARAMLQHRKFMRWSVNIRTKLVPTLRHAVNNALYLIDSGDPLDAVDCFLGMNATHLGSNRVKQDVLLLCGEHDFFQPPRLAAAQARALTSARSVSLRTFRRAEHADQHCQIGNLELACRVLTDWLADPRPIHG